MCALSQGIWCFLSPCVPPADSKMPIGVLHTKVPHPRSAFSFYLSFLPSACHAMANLMAATTFVTPYFRYSKILGGGGRREILRLPLDLKNKSSRLKVDPPRGSVASKISVRSSDTVENIFRTKLKMLNAILKFSIVDFNDVLCFFLCVLKYKYLKLKSSRGKTSIIICTSLVGFAKL